MVCVTPLRLNVTLFCPMTTVSWNVCGWVSTSCTNSLYVDGFWACAPLVCVYQIHESPKNARTTADQMMLRTRRAKGDLQCSVTRGLRRDAYYSIRSAGAGSLHI